MRWKILSVLNHGNNKAFCGVSFFWKVFEVVINVHPLSPLVGIMVKDQLLSMEKVQIVVSNK